MGLAVLLERGVRMLRAERSALDDQIGADRADAALAALDRLPDVLSSLNELAWREDAAPRHRAALTVVMSYGLQTDNLIPARDGRVLLGVLDDAYLAYFAAAQVPGELSGITAEDVAGARQALAAALPVEIVASLERKLTAALDEIQAFAERVQ